MAESFLTCPNCETFILSDTAQCPVCHFVFDADRLQSEPPTPNRVNRQAAHRRAEHLIQSALKKNADTLVLGSSRLEILPDSIAQLTRLNHLDASWNDLRSLPDWLGQLHEIQRLDLSANQLSSLPESLGQLTNLRELNLSGNNLTSVPEALGSLEKLKTLDLSNNKLSSLPESLGNLDHLIGLSLADNQLLPELNAAYKDGIDAVKDYLNARASGTTILNEAKLILIGEGEVGKSCLLDALGDAPWTEYPSTHGINIAPITVTDPVTKTVITMNGWDFGGQRVYRPTHQLFFSAPAVYLVVWKPREGTQAGQVKEWIKLVKFREPDARILVVATHGGPKERQPDIDEYEITSVFGHETVLGFHHVDSRPAEYDENTKTWVGERVGIAKLREHIARVAMQLPEVGRKVPEKWQVVRDDLAKSPASWMSYDEVVAFCTERDVNAREVSLFVKLSHTLGNLIHYHYDTTLRNIVILKPDWLATAISFVLDDAETRRNQGLVTIERLSRLWNDPERDLVERYPKKLHPAFLRLMERFDLSYEVRLTHEGSATTYLIGQLVPNVRPDSLPEWNVQTVANIEQVQICRIVDDRGQSATAEGLFYQLIVRLQKYSLGREDYHESVHWQRGLLLDGDYLGRALMEHIGNDVKITVRAAYPERFLAILTGEVKWLVEDFWEGLRCVVTVPCAQPCDVSPGTALFEVQKLINFRMQGLEQFPCHVSGCDRLQDIESLLRNASAKPASDAIRLDQLDDVLDELKTIRQDVLRLDRRGLKRFQALNNQQRRCMSQVDAELAGLLQTLTDEAKEGPRLFSFEAMEPVFFGRPNWVASRFRLTLWCEHSRLPLPELNEGSDLQGTYELELTREWVKAAAPLLKGITTVLSLVLPVASSATKLVLDDQAFKRISEQLDFGHKCADAFLKGSQEAGRWLSQSDSYDTGSRGVMRAEGSVLRQLQAMLKEIDPTFGGLVRVQNKRREFLWVHPQFVHEY